MPIETFSHDTDETLIRHWQTGRHQVFDVLYGRYYIKLLNIAYRKTGDSQLAEELVQDVFVALYQHLPGLQADRPLDGYLFILLRNRIYNYHRTRLARLKKEQAMPAADEAAFSAPLETRELETKLTTSIQALPPQCRTVFLLSREERLSNKEIAAKLDISVNTVEQHMRKALRLLRQSLEGYDGAVISLVWWLLVSRR